MEIPTSWTFEDESVAQAFSEHVREQLPWYDMVTRAVAHLIRNYVSHGGVVIDVGASNGNIGRSIAQLIEDKKIEFVPIEPSQQMAAMYDGPGAENMQIVNAEDFSFSDVYAVRDSADVVVFMLTLMFVRPDIRADVLREYINMVGRGGAVIIVDRTQSCGGDFGAAMHRLALAEKIKAGANPAHVMEKELSLMGNQRPLPRHWIEGSFGGKEFFRFGDFAGWIIEVL